ncbi:MAG: Trm112 family protein [Proteobacteria bacterium]|nr:Trm112 family protein [Pseudomonadota bacterium]
MEISKELFDVLACPKCKGELAYSTEPVGLICDRCSLLYPVQEGIPVMLIEKALSHPLKKI